MPQVEGAEGHGGPHGAEERVEAREPRAGRKVPVVGTIIVGVTDIFAIWQHPNDISRWAGLGSTLLGLIPVAGTALSALVDLGIVIGTIAENIHDLAVAPAEALARPVGLGSGTVSVVQVDVSEKESAVSVL